MIVASVPKSLGAQEMLSSSDLMVNFVSSSDKMKHFTVAETVTSREPTLCSKLVVVMLQGK